MNKLDKQYTALLQDILDNGVTKQDRTGTGTLSVFGRQIRHKMSEGFPLLTTKKMYFKGIVTELLWFLRGDTNIKYLVDNDCHIWDGDAYKNYLKWINEQSKSFKEQGIFRDPWTKEQYIEQIKLGNVDDDLSDLGPVYGKQWRDWGGYEKMDNIGNKYYTYKIDGIDQIQNSINLLKTDPDSRRNRVSAWNVGELDQMTLPPCHTDFQFYTRELSFEERSQYKRGNKETYPVSKWRDDMGISKEEYFNQIGIPTRAISLMWNQRSVDTFLGLPFNIASYGLLLEIIAKEVNMVPDELIGNLGDTHLYLDHIEQAKEQIGRELSLEERHQLALPIWKEKYGPLADMMVMTNVDNTPYKIPTRTREPFPLPKLFFKYEKETYIDNYELDGFILKDYQSHPTIKAPLSN
jgi:thymidylate synthase